MAMHDCDYCILREDNTRERRGSYIGHVVSLHFDG
jgi:hypothetical protein